MGVERDRPGSGTSVASKSLGVSGGPAAPRPRVGASRRPGPSASRRRTATPTSTGPQCSRPGWPLKLLSRGVCDISPITTSSTSSVQAAGVQVLDQRRDHLVEHRQADLHLLEDVPDAGVVVPAERLLAGDAGEIDRHQPRRPPRPAGGASRQRWPTRAGRSGRGAAGLRGRGRTPRRAASLVSSETASLLERVERRQSARGVQSAPRVRRTAASRRIRSPKRGRVGRVERQCGDRKSGALGSAADDERLQCRRPRYAAPW